MSITIYGTTYSLIDGQGNWASSIPIDRPDSIAEVVSSPTYNGSRSLHLQGFVSNATYTMSDPAQYNPIETLSFWYREQYGFGTNDTGDNSSFRIGIALSNGYSQFDITVLSICHAGTGHRSVLMTDNYIGNGSCVDGVGDMAEGNWYFIEVEYDFENKTARARVDGGEWGNSINLNIIDGYITSIKLMSIWDDPPQFWFDDLTLLDTTPADFPPSAPILLAPVDNEFGVEANNLMFQWNPSTDPDGDSIEYCVTVKEDGTPDDIPIFMGCDDGIFTSETTFILPVQLEPAKTYWWAVWARDENGNWSEDSEWWSFTTTISTTLEYLNELFNFSWYDTRSLLYNHKRESLYGTIQNCLIDSSFTLQSDFPWDNFVYISKDTNTWINLYRSFDNLPVFQINKEGRSYITPWLDAAWGNNISNDTSFNTVYKGYPEDTEKFEVISYVDELSPISATDNYRCYFFTYDTKKDQNGNAVTLVQWLDYLKAITDNYGRPIDILTIFSHGDPAEVKMSEEFHLINDDATKVAMERLKNDNILSSCDPTILLFSCEVGKEQIGEDFVQNMANWTGATVYANSVETGPYKENGGRITRDWELDVVKIPEGFVPCEEVLEAPVRWDTDATLMFPGGLMIEISEESLNEDGRMVITNVSDPLKLQELGIIIPKEFIFSIAYDISFEETVIRDEMYIKVTLPYAEVAGIDISDITVKYWDVNSMAWSEAGIWDIMVNEENHFVTFKTSHTSVFAVLFENHPPVANAGQDQIVMLANACLATVTLNGVGSHDLDEDTLSYSWTWGGGATTGVSPTIQLPLGTTTITLVVNDGPVDSDPATVNITVTDNTPPEINLSVSPDTLWPPNHKMVLIASIIMADDNCDSNPTIELQSITMNEGEETDTYDPNWDDTTGDGHTINDIQVDENGNIYLRAERSGTGTGRIYTITYTATDASGNSASASATVTVPHNQ